MNIRYSNSVTEDIEAHPISDPLQDSSDPLQDSNKEKTISTLENLAVIEGYQNLKERKKYATCTFWFVSTWTAAVITIGFFQGFSFHSFQLSDPILGTLMGGTMLKVLGTFYIILRYLFPSKK